MGCLSICARTDNGRKRPHNEDAFLVGGVVENKSSLILEVPMDSGAINTGGILAAVADGMGGYNAGEIASTTALRVFFSELMSEVACEIDEEKIPEFLKKAVAKAHEKLGMLGKEHPALSGMGTTLAGVFFIRDKLHIFHAGDSRVYRFRYNAFVRLTKDHSLVQALMNTGHISEAEAMTHPDRNVITNSVGGNGSCFLECTDKYGYFEDDVFLVCSDGLTGMLTDAVIEAVLQREGCLPAKAEALIGLANDAGGDDNITLILAQIRANDRKGVQ